MIVLCFELVEVVSVGVVGNIMRVVVGVLIKGDLIVVVSVVEDVVVVLVVMFFGECVEGFFVGCVIIDKCVLV